MDPAAEGIHGPTEYLGCTHTLAVRRKAVFDELPLSGVLQLGDQRSMRKLYLDPLSCAKADSARKDLVDAVAEDHSALEDPKDASLGSDVGCDILFDDEIYARRVIRLISVCQCDSGFPRILAQRG